MATAYRTFRAALACLGLTGLVTLSLGCGSRAYNEQLEATASKLRQGRPVAATPAAENASAPEAGQPAANAQPGTEPRNDGGGYGSPVANTLLAPP